MNHVEKSMRMMVADESSFALADLVWNLLYHSSLKTYRFNQGPLCDNLKKHSQLDKISLRFNGLCEIISNCVIANDLMGKHTSYFEAILASFDDDLSYLAEQSNSRIIKLVYNSIADYQNTYEQIISKNHLDLYIQSHILDKSTYLQQIMAYFWDVYPFSLFSSHEPIQLQKKVNQSIFKNRLDSLPNGAYIKFEVFHKKMLKLHGHSMVIKKTNDTFAFFDPNDGEKYQLDIDSLCQEIDLAMQKYDATHMAFLDGKRYISSVPITYGPIIYEKPRKHVDQEIRDLIFSKLEQILLSPNLLVNSVFPQMIDDLIHQIEDHVDNKEKHCSPYQSIRYLRDNTEHRLIRLYYKQLGYKKRILEEKFVNKKIKSATDVHEFLTKESMYGIIAFIKQSFYNYEQLPHSAYDAIIEHILLNMTTSYDAQLFLKEFGKQDQLYSSIKPHLINLMISAYDVYAIFKHLTYAQSQDIFELIKESLPTMIQTIGDLHDVWKYLNEQQRELISVDLQAIALSCKNTFYDFILGFSVLSHDKTALLFPIFIDKIANMNMDSDLDSFLTLYFSLNKAQCPIFLEAIQPRLPEIIDKSDLNDLCSLSKLLNIEQWSLLCDIIHKNKLFTHSIRNDLNIIDLEKMLIFLKATKDHMPCKMLEYIPREYIPMILEDKTISHLSQWIDTPVGLTHVLNNLPYAKGKILMQNAKMRDLLYKHFNKLQNEYTGDLIKALQSEDLAQIRATFDEYFRSIKSVLRKLHHKKSFIPYDLAYFKVTEQQGVSNLIKHISMFNNYLLQTLNQALQLDLSDELDLTQSVEFQDKIKQYVQHLLDNVTTINLQPKKPTELESTENYSLCYK